MEAKKNKNADLENKKGLFLELGFVISLSLVLIAFEWTSKPGGLNEMAQMEETEFEEEIIPVTRQQEVKPPPPPPKVTEVLNIVEDDVEIEDELMIDDVEADQDQQVEIVEFEEEEEASDEGEVFFIVEDMPKFRGGGIQKFRQYIQSNLEYPAVAAENGISGKVFVQFVVNKDGDIDEVKVVRGVDLGVNRKIIREIKNALD